MTVANEGAITVALDTRLTPELELEGWAREVVSKLQNMRKEAGLEVVDRIRVRYCASGTIADAIAAQRDYIANEILAVEMVAQPEASGLATVDLGGESASFAIEKA